MAYLIKILIAVAIIVIASELSKKNTSFAAILLGLPIVLFTSFTFIWEDSEEHAKLLTKKNNELVKFMWVNDEEDYRKYFFEFLIIVDEITKDVSLTVTDFSDEDELGTTEPMRDTGLRSPAEKLLQRMDARSKLDQMSPEEVEAIAGGDQKVMDLIRRIQGDLMYTPRSGI